MNNLFSIITPSYNTARFIEETINSVLAQSYQNWEMLIVDDCSKDNSTEIILNYCKKDNRIKLIQLTKNVGAAEARNIALRKAEGQFIAFLDSDDVWASNKLEKQLEFMKQKNIAFCFSSYQTIDISGKNLNKTIHAPKIIDYRHFLGNTIIGCLTVVIDKSKTGYFEMPNIKSSHDMALWLLIMKRGFKAYGIDEILASYRLVPTSNTANKWKAAKNVWRVYRQIEKINIISSFYYFICYSANAIKKRI